MSARRHSSGWFLLAALVLMAAVSALFWPLGVWGGNWRGWLALAGWLTTLLGAAAAWAVERSDGGPDQSSR